MTRGGVTGCVAWVLDVFSEWLPKTGLRSPTTLTLSPLMFTGRSIGSWMPLPDTAPGEPFSAEAAVAPPPLAEPPLVVLPPPVLAQLLPIAGLRSPTTFTVSPHTFTGMWTGSWIPLPEISPGEPTAAPSAVESAYTGPATAIAPEAAARAITPFRVTRFIGSLPSRIKRGHSPARR